jgi:hypothetical protein
MNNVLKDSIFVNCKDDENARTYTVKFLINAPPLIKAPRPFDKKNNLLISAELT